MDNDTKPSSEGQIKTLSRKARGKAVYKLPVSPALTEREKTAVDMPLVMNPDIGEHDVQIDFRIELKTRSGTQFVESEKTSLPGLLDPENRGHMAKIMERRFEEMRDLAVRGFNQLIERNLKAQEAKTKPPVEEPRMPRKFLAPGLIGGSPGEPVEEGLAPVPKPPGTFHPPLNPTPPPSTKN